MKLVKKIGYTILLLLATSSAIYFFGPKPSIFVMKPQISEAIKTKIPRIERLQNYVNSDQKINQLKPGNQSRIYWADSSHSKTEYVILYLHGFSASPMEGDPLHKKIAEKYEMNLYTPRLAEHGLLEEDNMLNFTAEKYLLSAKEALEVAHKLGDKVIVMSTSTGSTVGLYLASDQQNDIRALICYSPNVKLYDSKAPLLIGPWGIDISRLVLGGENHTWEAPKGADKYWHVEYRLEALVELQRLLEGTMKPHIFNSILVPTFVGYYYRNEEEQDDVVSVEAIKSMFDQLGSSQKSISAFPEAGGHCLPSTYFSRDVSGVYTATCKFIDEYLHVKP